MSKIIKQHLLKETVIYTKYYKNQLIKVHLHLAILIIYFITFTSLRDLATLETACECLLSIAFNASFLGF